MFNDENDGIMDLLGYGAFGGLMGIALVLAGIVCIAWAVLAFFILVGIVVGLFSAPGCLIAATGEFKRSLPDSGYGSIRRSLVALREASGKGIDAAVEKTGSAEIIKNQESLLIWGNGLAVALAMMITVISVVAWDLVLLAFALIYGTAIKLLPGKEGGKIEDTGIFIDEIC